MDQTGEKKGEKKYDVFISHSRQDSKPWVKILAQDLKKQGFEVFLDEWELVPGRSFLKGLYQGLNQSKNGILVITPKVGESEWVRKEYEHMLVRMGDDPDFAIIPVQLCDKLPDLPFFGSFTRIDFRDQNNYPQSFYSLTCAIKNIPPGANLELKSNLKMPLIIPNKPRQTGVDEISFVKNLFELFFVNQAVLLLAQKDRFHEYEKFQLLEQAMMQFGEKRCLNLTLPYCTQADMSTYYSFLGKQLEFPQSVTDSTSLIYAFHELFCEDQIFFLMVNNFEDSCKKGQEEISGVLRALNESFPQKLKILICGGEQLEELYYKGPLSYLNHAEICEFPELTIADIYNIMTISFYGLSIDEELV